MSGGSILPGGVKPQALLWYLAARPDQRITRSHLAELLWETGTDAERRHSLNTTLSRLRRLLPVWPLRGDRESLTWDSRADIFVDVCAFTRLLQPPRSHIASATTAVDERARLSAAVSLWRGPFLSGFHLPAHDLYLEWQVGQQAFWEHQMLNVLADLIQLDEMAGDWQEMASHAEQAIALDPFRDSFQRWLMLALYRKGDRAKALAQYESFRRLLADELGIEPEAELAQLASTIAAGLLPAAGGGAAIQAVSGGRAAKQAVPGEPAYSPESGYSAESGYSPPLVGRERDLLCLARACEMETGSPRLILLGGEAGIGKTRLVREWLRQWPPAAARTLLICNCYEDTGGLPYAPWLRPLEVLCHSLDLRRLHIVPRHLAPVARLVPALSDRFPDLPPSPPAHPAQEQRLLQEGLARFLYALPHPVVVVMEDIHWADPCTLEFLTYMAREVTGGGVTILATCRSGDLSEAAEYRLRTLRREGRLAWIDLAPLAPTAVRALVAAMGGTSGTDITDQILSESSGIPLFAVELVRACREAPMPRQAGEPHRTGSAIPAAIRDLVRARLERLCPTAHTLAEIAAVFPDGCDFSTLLHLAQLDEDQGLAALEDLLRAGFLKEMAETARIQFRYDLIRRAVLGSLSQARQQALLRRAEQYGKPPGAVLATAGPG